jgi:phosphate transport system substrate-binding protein
MKKLIALISFVFIATVAIAKDQITIVGSSTVYPFTTVVAEKHGQKGFRTPIVESTGTGGGMKLFCAGIGPTHPDFTNASRAIKKSERELCAKNGITDIIEIPVGNDGIAFAQNNSAKSFNVTVEELWQAMAENGSKPKNWNQINSDFPDQKIHILAPPPTSGTRDAWGELVMMHGCPAEIKKANKKDCEPFRQDGAVEEAGENDTLIVRRLAADPELFGIFGFSFLSENGDLIKAATVNGVEINLDTIQSYEYPIARPLFIYGKGEHKQITLGMQEFMDEYVSDAAVGEWGYLGDIGLVPLDPGKLEEVRLAVK